MAISRDSITAATHETSSTTLTFAHTCATNAYLWVGVLLAGPDANDHLTSVTYNSVTVDGYTGVYTGSSYNWIYLCYLQRASSGSNNIVITADTSCFIDATAVSYLGASDAVPEDSSTNTNASTTTISSSVTTSSSNCWTVACARAVSNGSLTAGASTYLVGGDPYIGFFDSDGPVSAGANSLTAETTPAQTMGIIVAGFSPYISSYLLSKIDGISTDTYSKINGKAIEAFAKIDGKNLV